MNDDSQPPTPPPRSLVVTAFVALYVIWGSTYLGMRVAVETMPPFFMAAARFLIAGILLYGWMRLRGAAKPQPIHWRNAAISGTLLLLGGNGLIAWAEQTVPSGLTALLVAIVPLWFALLDWLRPHGNRPDARTIVGIFIGFIGVAMLVCGRSPLSEEGPTPWAGMGAILIAGMIWAGGSLFMKYNSRPPAPLLGVAMQMISGGGALLLVSLLQGEFLGLNPGNFSNRSLLAFVWLIVAGAWIGYSSYIWLLQVTTSAKVSTYAYVNPVIAVFLGWLLLDEAVTSRTFAAAGVIITGVVIITAPKAVLQRLSAFGRRASGTPLKPEGGAP